MNIPKKSLFFVLLIIATPQLIYGDSLWSRLTGYLSSWNSSALSTWGRSATSWAQQNPGKATTAIIGGLTAASIACYLYKKSCDKANGSAAQGSSLSIQKEEAPITPPSSALLSKDEHKEKEVVEEPVQKKEQKIDSGEFKEEKQPKIEKQAKDIEIKEVVSQLSVKTKEQSQAENLIAEAQEEINRLNAQKLPSKELFNDMHNVVTVLQLAHSLDNTKRDELGQLLYSLRDNLKNILKSMYKNSFCGNLPEGAFERMADGMLQGKTFDRMINGLYDEYQNEKLKLLVYPKKYRCDFVTLIPFLQNQEMRENIFLVFQENGDVDAELAYMKTLSSEEFLVVAESSIKSWNARANVGAYTKDMKKRFKQAASQMH